MSNTAIIFATAIHIDENAINLPGQILENKIIGNIESEF